MVTHLRAILYNFLTGMHDEPLQHVSSKNDQIVDYAFNLNNISGWEEGRSFICVLGVFSGWEGGRSSICVLGVLILYLSRIFQLDFVTVPTLWYFLFF